MKKLHQLTPKWLLCFPRYSALAMGLVVLTGVFLSGALGAQEAADKEAKPAKKAVAKPSSFSGADVAGLLKWAKIEVGAGFLYNDKILKDAEGKKRQVSYTPKASGSVEENRIILFEALREVGLVPLPIIGVANEVYRVVPVSEAAQHGTVAKNPDELEGLYFGTLTYRAKTLSLEAAEALIRTHLSKEAKVLVSKETKVVIVADFIDGLLAAWDALDEADRPTLRDDDIVSEAFPCVKHSPEALARMVNGVKGKNEHYSAQSVRGSSVVLLTGQRADVAAAVRRLTQVEGSTKVAQPKLPLHTINCLRLKADDLQAALASYFAYEVARERMRFSTVRTRDQVLVAATKEDWARVREAMRAIDREPKSEAEAARIKRIADERAMNERKEARKVAKPEEEKVPAKKDEKKPD